MGKIPIENQPVGIGKTAKMVEPDEIVFPICKGCGLLTILLCTCDERDNPLDEPVVHLFELRNKVT